MATHNATLIPGAYNAHALIVTYKNRDSIMKSLWGGDFIAQGAAIDGRSELGRGSRWGLEMSWIYEFVLEE